MGKILKMRIPGIYFSWKRVLGVTKNKRIIADKMWIPMSKGFDNDNPLDGIDDISL